jgi:hypothetical protein
MERTPLINMVAQVRTNSLSMVFGRLSEIRRTTLLGAVMAAAATSITPAMAAEFFCTPTEVAVHANRVHVRCSTAAQDGGASIGFWAISTSDAQIANRFVSTATTALVSGRSLRLYYDAGKTPGTSFGCLASDCRTPWAIAIY